MAFKMKGPSLYRKGNENMKDGRAKSSAFQIGKKTMNPFKQTKVDLKEWLLDQKGFSQTEADQMIRDGAYDLNNKNFKIIINDFNFHALLLIFFIVHFKYVEIYH